MFRGRTGSALVAAMGCALGLGLIGCDGASRTGGAQQREPSPSGSPAASVAMYTVLQMNLCLSGLAGCYGKAAYPAVVEEAADRIGEVRPDAATLNEVCRDDV